MILHFSHMGFTEGLIFIVIAPSRLNVAGEIPLEGELCTALGAEDGRLYLFIDKNMEIYEEKDGS